MTLADTEPIAGLLHELALAGLTPTLRDGEPFLVGDRASLTPELRSALRTHRQAVIDSLSPPKLREWLWPKVGMLFRESPEGAAEGDTDPWGAWWWRYEGEAPWLCVPGRGDGRAPNEHELANLPYWQDAVIEKMTERIVTRTRDEAKQSTMFQPQEVT